MARLSHLTPRMARTALLVAGSCLTSGCLLGSPPDYESEAQTTPVLLAAQADPPLSQLILASDGDSQEFRVPFRSEDAGEPLTVALYRNFEGGLRALTADTVAPGSNLFSDELRFASRTYAFGDADQGCNSFTLLITHASNLKPLAVPREGREDKLAFITWWVNFGEPTSVDLCGIEGQ